MGTNPAVYGTMPRFRTKQLRLTYAALTLPFLILQGWSALQYLGESARMTGILMTLGYPLYVMKILAVAKLLGIAAIAIGSFATLKEWAYAGFVFEACGALASHLCAGDSLTIAPLPVISLTLGLVSFLLWKQLLRQLALRRRHYEFGVPPRDTVETHA